jgi:hypothetical protein
LAGDQDRQSGGLRRRSAPTPGEKLDAAQDRSSLQRALLKATPQEQALETTAALAAMGSFLGPLGAVAGSVWGLLASGFSADLKQRRLVEVIEETRKELELLSSSQSDYVNWDYVQGEDFQDLAAKALQQAADERSEAKRRFYARYIAGLAGAEPVPYEERKQELRTLEELRLQHLAVLRTLDVTDPFGVLTAMVYGLDETIPRAAEHEELMDQLVSMGLVRWKTEVKDEKQDTAVHPDRLKTWSVPTLTRYAWRLLTFIRSAADTSGPEPG